MNDATKAPQRIWVNPKAVDRFYEGFSIYSTPAGFTEPPCLWPDYILATPAALAASPEVAALIREAEARGMERAARIIDDMPQNEGDDFAGRIRAEAAALRGEKETK